MTYHAQVERVDRISACLATLGMNEFILEVKRGRTIERLTDTGILFVFGRDDDKLITGYIANPMRVAAMYKSCGYKEAPRKVWLLAARNSQRYKYLTE